MLHKSVFFSMITPTLLLLQETPQKLISNVTWMFILIKNLVKMITSWVHYLYPILHGGGVELTPPGWLLYANPRGMHRMDWFFMTLFLSILERPWVGHFWDFFLKFPKKFTSTIFSTYNPKGGPFYASVWTPAPSIFFVLFLVKNGNNSTPNA